jgi:hypothetical protein
MVLIASADDPIMVLPKNVIMSFESENSRAAEPRQITG